MPAKKRYAQVGLGGRSLMFSNAVVDTFADSCELVALCDTNPGRLEQRVTWARDRGVEVPGYGAADFDRMVAERRPDVVIVTSKDSTHDQYLVRAMELGCEVVTEKPMTTDAHKCQSILDTQRRTGRPCTVTFNYRYSPPRSQVKDLLMSGVIGNLLSVDFHWLLNIRHGADYFRRWHRNKENSGGLMVHKATHHFDLVNWWLSTVPETVFASGHRRFYTAEQGDRYGLHDRGERCLDCPEAGRCPFHLDLRESDRMRELYLDHEHHDGYFRDRCVFSDQIDIEDCMNVLVDYRNGVRMSYSLNAFMPWEGYQVVFNGTKGRLEHKCEESVYVSGDGSVPGALIAEGTWTRIFPHFAPAYEVDLWKAEGGHGGGDDPLLRGIFHPNAAADPLKRAAAQRAGAWSVLTGIAANQSMTTGSQVRIDSLVSGLEEPDYPAMPTATEPMPVEALEGRT